MTPFSALFLIFAGLAAGSDLRDRRVSNALNLTIFVAGLAARFAFAGFASAGWGMVGAIVGLVSLLPLFAARWIGGGDVKLVGAMCSWRGPEGILLAALAGLAGGTLLASGMTICGGAALRAEVAGNLEASFYAMSAPAPPKRDKRLVVPMAVPLAAAACAVLLFGGLHA